ncbi:MAG TPA: (deoxy)nucleoside triphosphate pyrophosphohydrolase, partial [bacterium]|nr:(deoxy)nucleoside triphosphate pyrophosphohydrolase [bacterium]
ILHNKQSILLAQRKADSHNSLKWEFPGGTLEKKELLEDCLMREIKEELNIEIKVKDIYQVIYHKCAEKNILLLFYFCKYLKGRLQCIDCNAARWINIVELLKYDLCEPDRIVAKKLIKKIKTQC